MSLTCATCVGCEHTDHASPQTTVSVLMIINASPIERTCVCRLLVNMPNQLSYFFLLLCAPIPFIMSVNLPTTLFCSVDRSTDRYDVQIVFILTMQLLV